VFPTDFDEAFEFFTLTDVEEMSETFYDIDSLALPNDKILVAFAHRLLSIAEYDSTSSTPLVPDLEEELALNNPSDTFYRVITMKSDLVTEGWYLITSYHVLTTYKVQSRLKTYNSDLWSNELNYNTVHADHLYPRLCNHPLSTKIVDTTSFTGDGMPNTNTYDDHFFASKGSEPITG
jgi:hypothetical protein